MIYICLFGIPIFTNFVSQDHSNINFSMTEKKSNI